MKNKFENILLILLWLLAMLLAACFWFNTQYNFNIFALQHWQYLGYLQASGAIVPKSFYISHIIITFVTCTGLYILLHPHVRAPRPAKQTPKPVATTPAPQPTHAPAIYNIKPPAPTHTAQNNRNANTDNTVPTPLSFARPARLTLPRQVTAPNMDAHPTATPKRATQRQSPTQPSETLRARFKAIFTDAGYIVKDCGRIGTVTPALLAIGTGEVLWLGATDISSDALVAAMERLNTLFIDTLDEVTIDIRGFIVRAPDGQQNKDSNILYFDSDADLEKYIAAHRNPPVDDDDKENFDAYSEYIDTVVNYMTKL